jgi:hypothetical protein
MAGLEMALKKLFAIEKRKSSLALTVVGSAYTFALRYMNASSRYLRESCVAFPLLYV